MNILPSLSLLNKINQFIQVQQGGTFSLNYGLFLLSWKSGLRVSEAVSFDYNSKHPRHRDLYLVHGKGNKTRYVYVSQEIIQKLKTNYWQPNQTNRFIFNNFLKKVKAEMNISKGIELTPHTLRRCFTTHNAINGVPMPILQKALGHVNIRTTSEY
ncbi:MAG: site-specific integrase [Mollicutes bacterium UO1]